MKEILKDIRENASKKILLAMVGCSLLENVSLLAAVLILAWLIDGVFLQGHRIEGVVLNWVLLLFVFLICQYTGSHGCRYYINQLSVAVRLRYRNRLGNCMLGNNTASASQYSNLCCENVDAIDEFCQKVLPLAITAVVRMPLFLVAIFAIDWLSGIVFLITVPIAPFLLYLLGKVIKEASQQEWDKQVGMNRAFHELMKGMLTLKIFRRTAVELEKLQELSRDYSASSLKVLRIAFLSAFTAELITTLSIAVSAVTIGLRILEGRLDFLSGFAILLMAPSFYMPLRMLGTAFHVAMNTKTAVEAIHDIMPSKGDNDAREYSVRTKLPPDVEIRNISFAYPNCQVNCLEGISFKARAGRLTVITGSSGAGKSTVLQLIAGVYGAEQGEILLNGLDTKNISQRYMNKIMGYVPQEPHVFSMSLRENITMGGEFSDRECEEALKVAGLGGWYENLSRGLSTMLGDNGVKLSNGQRHRLGLCRMILRNPHVLLLDELTAGLELAEEQELLISIKQRFFNKTIIMVSHRQQVLEAADEIIQIGGDCRE